MVTNHRKKNSRHQGSWSNGHGEKKKRRGAGHRGGRGNAGSGKRGDAQKPSFWKKNRLFGNFGFKNYASKNIPTITLSALNTSIEQLVQDGVAQKDGSSFVLDLSTIKVKKVLGTGTPLFSYKLTVAHASEGAIKKIEAAGGSVSVTAEKK